MTSRLIYGSKTLQKHLDCGGEGETTPSNRPNLILWDKLITMTDEGLFTSPQREKSGGGQKKESSDDKHCWFTGARGQRDGGQYRSEEAHCQIQSLPYKRSYAGSLGTCPSAECDTYPRCDDWSARWARLWKAHRLLRPARLGACAEMKLSFTARLSQRASPCARRLMLPVSSAPICRRGRGGRAGWAGGCSAGGNGWFEMLMTFRLQRGTGIHLHYSAKCT